MPTQSNFSLVKRLWHHLSTERHRQFCLLIGLMILVSIAEMLSVGALFPFLKTLSNADVVYNHPGAQYFIKALGIKSAEALLLPLLIIFGLVVIITAILKLLLLWASSRFSFSTGSDLSASIYRRTLYQPYSVHVNRNSSEVINGIVTKANGVIYGVLSPILSLISSSLILIAVLAILISIDFMVSISVFLGFGTLYWIVIWLTRFQKIKNSKLIACESTQVIKSLQEGLGGIRDILVDGSQSTYCDIYKSADYSLRRAESSNHFIIHFPRYGLEALGMLFISIAAYLVFKQSEDISKVIPVLGVMALGAQRMLPLMQVVYSSWSSVQGCRISLSDTLNLLDQPLPSYYNQEEKSSLNFSHKISLEAVSFRYNHDAPWIFKELNLEISKGSCIGFIGKTGSGKSTLIDIVMGLLRPTQGVLKVDSQVITAENQRAWQFHIAHVPQAIFLADSTIEENIAFGQPKNKINHLRVIQAARDAKISDFIETLPNKYEAVIGERGVRISGGQRQRLGIARALYKNADVIIFDEATSALDSKTEAEVIDTLDGLSKNNTILIIAHRLTTLKKCSQIVEIAEGKIQRIGSYEEIVLNKST
jgi:ABC-type bacteriocin/lantibiotic exporter with double-glycine peptidase domain